MQQGVTKQEIQVLTRNRGITFFPLQKQSDNGLFNTCFRTRVKYNMFTLLTFSEKKENI